MNEMPKILMRVDATKEVALGHLKRCTALACKLQERGVEVTFLTAQDSYTELLLRESGFSHFIVNSDTNSEGDFRKTKETMDALGAAAILIDSYRIDDRFRQCLMDGGFFVISINDTAHMNGVSHVIFNGNPGAEEVRYEVVGGTKLFLGSQYLIMGREFWSLKKEVPFSERVSNFLITMGGTDHYDLTTKALEVIDGVEQDFSITVIAGPYYENRDSMTSQIDKMHKRVDLIDSPSALFPYLRDCSLAFCSGGQTLLELAALGKPAIGIALRKNQASNVAFLSQKGAASGMVYSAPADFKRLFSERLTGLLNDASGRKRMSEAASSLVDGKGAGRVTEEIVKSYETWSLKKPQDAPNRRRGACRI